VAAGGAISPDLLDPEYESAAFDTAQKQTASGDKEGRGEGERVGGREEMKEEGRDTESKTREKWGWMQGGRGEGRGEWGGERREGAEGQRGREGGHALGGGGGGRRGRWACAVAVRRVLGRVLGSGSRSLRMLLHAVSIRMLLHAVRRCSPYAPASHSRMLLLALPYAPACTYATRCGETMLVEATEMCACLRMLTYAHGRRRMQKDADAC
jgi:hypothetical protein